MMFDIDGFKTINDELGHLRGDEVLRAVGAQLQRVLRSTDIPCRYGGDEFLIILPDTDILGAGHAAETLRREIATLAIAATEERVIAVTASVGLAAAAPAELDVAELIVRADEALYRAKRAGRNRVCASAGRGDAPQALEPCPRDRSPSSLRSTATGSAFETILVVDDEPFARDLTCRALEPLGYTILTASNAAGAIAIAEAHRGPIQLLVTDLVMPDLSGLDLAPRIRLLRPEINLLYMSGFLGDPAIGQTTGSRQAGFLQKPFTPHTLATKVREALDSAGLVTDPPDPDRTGTEVPHPRAVAI
jgi:diguanylate cyclase (GGDEF)-like protein